MLLTFIAAKVYYGRNWMETLYPTILFFLFAIAADIICGTILQLGGVSAVELMGGGAERLFFNIFATLLLSINTHHRQKYRKKSVKSLKMLIVLIAKVISSCRRRCPEIWVPLGTILFGRCSSQQEPSSPVTQGESCQGTRPCDNTYSFITLYA